LPTVGCRSTGRPLPPARTVASAQCLRDSSFDRRCDGKPEGPALIVTLRRDDASLNPVTDNVLADAIAQSHGTKRVAAKVVAIWQREVTARRAAGATPRAPG